METDGESRHGKSSVQREDEGVEKLVSRSSTTMDRFKSDVVEESWSVHRKAVAWLIGERWFETLFGLLVVVSLVLAIVDTDSKASNTEPPPWVEPLENVLLALYVIEVSLRVFVFRMQYCVVPQNVLDFLIVFIDVVFFFIGMTDIQMPQVAFLRVLRLMKLTRTFHLLTSQPELYLLVQSFLGSLKATIFGCVFITVALAIFGIIAVEFLSPLNVDFAETCSTCHDAFDSVYYAMVTMMETVVVGDTWGELFLPFLKKYPITAAYIIPLFVVVHLSLMNLIMAVIVDAAHRARKLNDREMAIEKERELELQKKKLLKLCKAMDTNESGSISLSELLSGYEQRADFKRCMAAMDISEDDLVAVFNILDQDGSGDAEYDEFVEQLYKMKNSDSHTMLVFIKHYVTDVRKKIFQELTTMNEKIAGGIEVLQETLNSELQLIRDDMSKQMAGLDAIGKQFVTGIEKESKALPSEEKFSYAKDSCHLPSDASVVTLKANGQKSEAIDCELHNAVERITLVLEELKAKCESSSVLLANFKDIRSRIASCESSSPRISTETYRQPILNFSMQDGARPAWHSKLARTQQHSHGSTSNEGIKYTHKAMMGIYEEASESELV